MRRAESPHVLSELVRYVNPIIFARKGNGFLTPPFQTPLSFYMRSDTACEPYKPIFLTYILSIYKS